MEIIHDFGNTGIKKKGNADSFLLTNGLGGYASLSAQNSSKFQGVYFAEGSECYKAIENIIIEGQVSVLRNKLTSAARVRGDAGEFFYMPNKINAFAYELSRQKQIKIILDCRKQLDFNKWGRYYRVYHKGDALFVKYSKKSHPNEGKKSKGYEIYIAIHADRMDYEKTGKWEKTSYEFDRKRNDESELYVYDALKINASKLVFGFGTTEEKAEESLRQALSLKTFEELPAVKIKFILDSSINMAYLCSQQSLHKLFANFRNQSGILAGLPWFNQFWSRDEIISTGALISLKEYGTAKEILFKYLGMIGEDGRLPNIDGSKTENADSVGWLFKRLFDLIKALKNNKQIATYFTVHELYNIKHSLEKSINGILKSHSKGELITNASQETWCDTKIAKREGARIEIQALQLLMYNFMKWLSKKLRDKSAEKYAAHKEEMLFNEVRKKFWNRHYLNDGEEDKTIRPNVFLACYIYPHVLTDVEWRKCFDNVIPRLYNGFGLSSIDMHSPDFRPLHTGMTDESYHNGDSWYWINNIAAICLYRLGKFRYAKYIHNILKGSTNDILWQGGVPGCASEISSATKQESFGCFNQAWSDATYIEMVDEMF